MQNLPFDWRILCQENLLQGHFREWEYRARFSKSEDEIKDYFEASCCSAADSLKVVFSSFLWQFMSFYKIPRKNNRITEYFVLEGTFKGSLLLHPSHGQGHLSSNQVAQSTVKPEVKDFQGWNIHSFPGQPLPVSASICITSFFPYVQTKPTLFLIKTVVPCRVTTALSKVLSIFFLNPLYILKGCNKTSLKLSPVHAVLTLSAFPHRRAAPGLWSFLWPSSGPGLTYPRLSCTADPRTGCNTPDVIFLEGRIISLDLQSMSLLMQYRIQLTGFLGCKCISLAHA